VSAFGRNTMLAACTTDQLPSQ